MPHKLRKVERRDDVHVDRKVVTRVTGEDGRTIEMLNDGEVVFLLRGRDRCTPATVRDWARLAAAAGAPALKIGDAMLDAEAIERWQREHGSKVPD